LNQALTGKINALYTISFNQSADTTTLTNSRLGVNSFVVLLPITANAASAAGSSWWISDQTNGSCVIHHENTAMGDRSYRALING